MLSTFALDLTLKALDYPLSPHRSPRDNGTISREKLNIFLTFKLLDEPVNKMLQKMHFNDFFISVCLLFQDHF